ncbi:hypothetical protein TthTF25_05740 [Thermus thermophilus]
MEGGLAGEEAPGVGLEGLPLGLVAHELVPPGQAQGAQGVDLPVKAEGPVEGEGPGPVGPQGLHHALGVPAKKRLEKGFLRGVGGPQPQGAQGPGPAPGLQLPVKPVQIPADEVQKARRGL